MKKALLTLLLLIAFPVLASHIVGGEFELLHISGDRYRLNLIYYFDELNGAQANKTQDRTISAKIFRFSDGFLMDNVSLPFVSQTSVSYTQPACSNGKIVTSKQFYSTEIILSPDRYNDSQGYYVVWERCCRNYTIQNIISQNPNGVANSPNAAGQTFYLKFPPVVKNGTSFINSSPHLFPPLNDYACLNRPYYVNFAGIDDDNDSLVYSLTTPLDTQDHTSYPQISSAPYPTIRWVNPFSLDKVMNALPKLAISKDGLLTVTPQNQEGIFVFAVKVDEFRGGVKIGESRRDFQMLVIDCPKAEPPVIVGKKSSDASFPAPSSNSLSVSFANTISDNDRFIEVKVSDKDSFKDKAPDFLKENIKIRVVPINFKRKSTDTWPDEITTVLNNAADSIKTFKIYFPQCPYINGDYQVGIIAGDDACSLPLLDTLKVIVSVKPPTNTPAYFTTAKLTTAQIIEGDPLVRFPFIAKDDDLDDLVISVLTDGFVLKDAGMAITYTTVKGTGLATGELTWDPQCNLYDFTKRTAFTIKILANDQDLCNLNDPDVAIYKLNIKLPGNADPIIDTDLTSAPSERKVTLQRKIFETVSFNVTGKDLVDNDILVLSGKGVGFSMSDYSASFSQVSSSGLVSSRFYWNISCDKIDLKKKDQYTFQFIVVDNSNKCRFYKADTVDIVVKLSPPDNAKPQLTAFNASLQSVVNNSSLEYLLGQPIEINLVGTDADILPVKDNLTLSLINAPGDVDPQGYTFQEVTGTSPVRSVLSWTPDCSIFKNQVYENNYTFQFKLADNRCLNAKADTVSVKLKIKDVDGSGKDFYMPNVFTPNGDNHNDYFALEGIDADGGEVNLDEKISLPKDNCADHFESIKIFNRWGKQVFESTDRKFRWYAPDENAGVYYYRVKYANREFKSPLSILY
ncbi:MAG: gliding motility-associated C-terminal domain-containing protein [Cyclobacteriaceae bacterium]